MDLEEVYCYFLLLFLQEVQSVLWLHCAGIMASTLAESFLADLEDLSEEEEEELPHEEPENNADVRPGLARHRH